MLNLKKKIFIYLAVIMDGDGYFQIRTINGIIKISTIEVKVHIYIIDRYI